MATRTFSTSRNPKIDNQAINGLSGVSNSLSYMVHELKKHFHNSEDWMCLAAVPDGTTHTADDITTATGAAPFVIDAGNETWGAWVQILGSGDTPVRAGTARYDFHRLEFVASEAANISSFVQLSWGVTGGAGLAAGDYSTLPYLTPTNQAAETPAPIMMPAVVAGTNAWARCFAVGQNTMTLSFYAGLHEYPGV